MAAISRTGPLIATRSGGMWNYDSVKNLWYPTPPTTSGVSSVRQWESYSQNSKAAKRVKPRFQYLLPTAWNQNGSFRLRAVWSDNTGNTGPEDYQAGSIAGAGSANQVIRESEELALKRLLEKIKGETWNLSTFVGELPETLRFIREVAIGLVSSYRAVKRGDMRKMHAILLPLRKQYNGRRTSVVPARNSAAYTSSFASKRWLEWRYAIQPLMYEYDSMLKTLYDSSINPRVRRFSAVAVKDIRDTISNVDINESSRWKARAEYVVYGEVKASVAGFKKLGLLNPVATLWELTPLSFVADWFIPIGDYVASLDAMAGITVLSSTRNTKMECRMKRKLLYGTANKGNRYQKWSTESVYEDWSYSRIANPVLSLPFPSFQIGLNASRVLDSLSLLRGVIRN